MRLFVALGIVLTLASAAWYSGYENENDAMPRVKHSWKKIFGYGEKIEYKVKVRWLTVGEATLSVDKHLYSVNDKPCFKMTAEAVQWAWRACGQCR